MVYLAVNIHQSFAKRTIEREWNSPSLKAADVFPGDIHLSIEKELAFFNGITGQFKLY